MSIATSPQAQILSVLRTQGRTRYQIQELLGGVQKDHVVNKLLEHLWDTNLVERRGVLYALTRRGTATLQLIDHARTAHRVQAEPKTCMEYSSSERELMQRGRVRATSAADLRPAPARAGSLRFLECPSRWGDTLRYRDGRVTDLAGRPV